MNKQTEVQVDHQQMCPHCGYCPTCGRSNRPTGFYPYPYPVYPLIPTAPTYYHWPTTYTTVASTVDTGALTSQSMLVSS